MGRRLLLVGMVVGCAGCALIFKTEPLTPHYYTPLAVSAKVDAPTATAGELRLRRVTAASYLRERMVQRTTARLYEYSEERLWTEPPADYVRRALGRELFEVRGVRRSLRTGASTLEVELTAFDDLLAENVARVEVVVWLHADQRVIFEETFSAQAEVGGGEDRHEAFASAAGVALAEVVEAVAARVVASLR